MGVDWLKLNLIVIFFQVITLKLGTDGFVSGFENKALLFIRKP